MKKKIELTMTLCILAAAFILARQGAILVQTSADSKTPSSESRQELSPKKQAEPSSENDKKICIAVDAGHGGFDPGKIGINGALEKDINLALALKLKTLLEENNIEVVLTRENDNGLYSENSNNKKIEDMQKRCQIITEANPAFTVSLHQNSYPTADIKGAQVFYYGQSAKGKELAELIQQKLISEADPENHRQAKANESYYLLKKTPTPTVIVECGFLSNEEEAALLLTEDYQNLLVHAIYLGISEYLQAENLL